MNDWFCSWIDDDVKLTGFRKKCLQILPEVQNRRCRRRARADTIDAFNQIQFDTGGQTDNDIIFVVDDVKVRVVEQTFVVDLQRRYATWS